jgi:hypothetical protein
MGIMQAALKRHDSTSLGRLVRELSLADGSIKGFADGNPWDRFEDLILQLATGQALFSH